MTKSSCQCCCSVAVSSDNVSKIFQEAMEAGKGILRLTPTWVPRVFMQPGRRIKLAPTDWYALGVDRGGINERWFSSTTEAGNPGRQPDEGLSYVKFNGQKFLLRDAVAEGKGDVVGEEIWSRYKRWPVYSKFFDDLGPLFHHLHQREEHAKLVGQEGKPEAYYFPPQLNAAENFFDYTFMGFEPGTTKDDVKKCLENWNKGDNGILDLSKAYRLKRGTGWIVPAGVLHAPGSLCTYEPQWGSDVFGSFQSLVERRQVEWSWLVKDVPKEKHHDLDYIISMLDWEKNVDPYFKDSNYIEPIVDEKKSGDGYIDKWITYGKIDGKQLFSAKELTVLPGYKCTIHDASASGWIFVQGHGKVGDLTVDTPVMINYGAEPNDEIFVTAVAAKNGVTIENTGSEPLVALRYFGPNAHPTTPDIGDHKKLNSGKK
jgi:mannose-6-phosphate isomerase-like protein (cupin superfamily)